MHLVLLKAVYEPVHHNQLIGRRRVLLNHTSAACRLRGGDIVLFVIVTGGVPPVSVASHISNEAESELLEEENTLHVDAMQTLRNQMEVTQQLLACRSGN